MRVFILAAITADGLIGRHSDHLADWTSPEDKRQFVRLTKEAGVIVMGAKTFATIGRALPGRRMIVYTSNPDSVTAEGVETTNEEPASLLERLKSEGAQGMAICGGATIYGLFMQAGLVDELYLAIEPLLFGSGVGLFNSELSTQLTLIAAEPLGDNAISLHYRINRSQ